MAGIVTKNQDITESRNYRNYLFEPMKWCRRKIETVSKNIQNIGNYDLKKIGNIAKNIILGMLLLIPTALSIIPYLIGIVVKPTTTKESSYQIQDDRIAQRCKEIGITDWDKTDVILCREMRKHLGKGNFTTCNVLTKTLKKGKTRIISLQISQCHPPILDIFTSRKQSPDMDIQELLQYILGLEVNDRSLAQKQLHAYKNIHLLITDSRIDVNLEF